MIRTVLLLARTSLLNLLFLAAALLTLVTVVQDSPEEEPEAPSVLAAALAPIPASRATSSDGAAALRIALFDPERRPETVAGSIDDLREIAAPREAALNVVLSGVLVDGHKARAMLNVVGGPSSWSDVGADVGGWRVASIDAQGAVLEHEGRSVALKVADRWRTRGQPHADAASGAPPSDAGSEQPAPAPAGDAVVAPDPVEPPKP